MAKYIGNNGVVKVDTEGGTPSELAQVVSFSVTETATTVQCDAMGDTWEEHKPVKQTFSGSITCRKDSLIAQQQLLRAGTVILFELYPEGETSGLEKISGSGIITSRGVEVEMGSAVDISFDFQGTGELVVESISS